MFELACENALGWAKHAFISIIGSLIQSIIYIIYIIFIESLQTCTNMISMLHWIYNKNVCQSTIRVHLYY